MRLHHYLLLAFSITVTGCSSSGSVSQTTKATNLVQKIDTTKVDAVKIGTLHESFLTSRDKSQYNETVVQVTGDVVAFALTEDNLYTVTLQDGDSNAICVFDNSISGDVGDGRKIFKGATLTVRGQCFTSGLFSSSPYSIDGCHIVED
jgi:hypothetical protein